MEWGDPRECELERELDSLYRKVAGLDQPGDELGRTVSGTDRALTAKAEGQRTARSADRRTRGRRLPARFAWGIAAAVLCLGAIGMLRWQTGGGVPAPGALSASERGAPAKEERRSPADRVVIALAAEEAGDHAAGHRYAIQIRAYPEGQKQQALAFLEELGKQAPDASLEAVSIADRGLWYRILLGDFATVEEAAEYRRANRTARSHPYGFIQRKYAEAPRPSPAPRSSSAGSPAQP